MIKLAVFDWNATILDDVQLTINASQREFDVIERGHEVDLDFLQQNFEVPMRGYYRKVGISDELFAANWQQMNLAFHDYYEAHIEDTTAKQGALELLSWLEAHQIPRIILSNHHVKGITEQVERLGLTQHFTVILANDDINGAMHLGKFERLKEYLHLNDYDPTQAFIVGDTTEEVVIGQEMGMRTVSITGGMSTSERLKAAKPDVLIDSLHDLIPVLEEWT